MLSYGEIDATLDESGTCEGLEFMEGMKRYCGQRLAVKKRVQMMFDERRWRTVRVRRPRYILEAAICDGNARQVCDRCCFFFWSPRWLRRPD